MKSAKEMFEKIGYRKSRYENTYYKTYKNGKEVFISFDKKIKKVSECFTSTDNKEIQFLIDNINQLGNKINKIIDKINKMEDK